MLVRYTGPQRAFLGLIGEAIDGGMMVGGRLRRGTVEPVTYSVEPAGVALPTWGEAVETLAAWLDDESVAWLREAPESINGVEIVSDGTLYAIRVT